MPTYLSPGVYIEEREGGTRPIEAVGTAVAAFVGFTEKAEERSDGQVTSLQNRPVAVTNWTQFTDKFGGFVEGAYLPYSVYGYFLNGGSRCYVVSVKTLGASVDEKLATPAAAMLPARTEAKADTLEIKAKSGGPAGNAIKATIKESDDAAAETFTLIIAAPGGAETFSSLTFNKGEQNVETMVNARSQFVTVRVLQAKGTMAERRPLAGEYPLQGGKIETAALTVASYRGEVAARTGLGGLTPVDEVTMVAVPDLMQSYQAGELSLQDVQAVQQALYEHCEQSKYAFAILDCPPDLGPQAMLQWRQASNYDTKYAALYYPWIETADMVKGKGSIRIPPSGHVSGVYARSDAERGVHKAPANEVVRGATGLPVQLTRGEQDALNPIGVNCIRAFPGRGIRIWGARSLSSDPAWRYINVRRLFNMVEESIERGTQWVVFEPNDPDLWARVRRDVTAFLRTVWTSGALFGATPNEAFYVKCDEELNPVEVRDLGQLIIEIGMCPVKPAEFVIFRISQWAGPAAA
jgi:phage tail sheath protein FI